jgi:hypothetical protein
MNVCVVRLGGFSRRARRRSELVLNPSQAPSLVHRVEAPAVVTKYPVSSLLYAGYLRSCTIRAHGFSNSETLRIEGTPPSQSLPLTCSAK